MVDTSLSLERTDPVPMQGGDVRLAALRRATTVTPANPFQIDLRFFNPPRDLEGCFTTFYRMELTVPDGGVVVDHLQPEWANLRFFSNSTPDCRIHGSPTLVGADFAATGPSSLPLRFELSTTRMWGVGLF